MNDDVKAEAYKGFETWLARFKMNLKMVVNIAITVTIFQLIFTLIVSYVYYSESWKIVLKYAWQSVLAFDGHYFSNVAIPRIGLLLKKSIVWYLLSFGFWIFVPIALILFKRISIKETEIKWKRGGQIITADALKKQLSRDKEKTYIPIGNIKMPVTSEPKHTFVIGKPGSGKTVAMSGIIEALRARGDRGIIYDFKGDYMSRFYDPKTDLIFNPLDARCCGWSIFNEIETFYDIDAVAHSLISLVYQSDAFWNDAARDVFSGILHYLYQNNQKKNADIWAAVTAPGNVIAGRLRQTKGGERGHRYIEDASSKQAMSVFSVLMQYVKATEFMTEADGDFSVGRWLEDRKPGFIFITNYSSVRDTLRPILSLFIDLMGRRLLSMSEDYNRRVFFMLDEFGTLQRLSTIVELLTLSRSKGGAVFLGIQDVGQIDKIYRHETRQSIVNACGTNVIFSVGDPDTARFLSDKVGDTEVLCTDETHSMGPSDQRDGLSLIRKTKIEKLVLPSDIQNMQDLTAYVKLPNYDVVPVQFKYKRYPELNNPFMMNACFSLSGGGMGQGHGSEEVTDGEKVLRESEVEKERGVDSGDLKLIEQETNI